MAIGTVLPGFPCRSAREAPGFTPSRRYQGRIVEVYLARRHVALGGLHQLVAESGFAREDELLQVGERVIEELVVAGEIAAATNSSGISLYFIISTFSPPSSSRILLIRERFVPIQAPMASTFASLDDTAILVLDPASREIDLISTVPS